MEIAEKIEASEKGVVSKSRNRTCNQQERSALIDITNDSPIVGLAMGSLKTPNLKRIDGQLVKNNGGNTPGSGEALLRGQVKTLLQKVEEEAEISKFLGEKNGNENGAFGNLKGLGNSPMGGLLAPTPNNTPHVSNLSGGGSGEKNGLASVTSSPVQEDLTVSQV